MSWWQPVAIAIAIAIVAALACLLVYRLVWPLAGRFVRRSETLQAVPQRLKGPLSWVVPLVVLQIVWEGVAETLPGLDGVQHLTGVLLIVAATAAAIRAVRGVARP